MIYLWSPQLSKSSPSTPPSVDAATARRGPTARDARGGPGRWALRGVPRRCPRAPRQTAAWCGGQRLLRHGAGGPPSNPDSSWVISHVPIEDHLTMIGINGLLDGYFFRWCPIFPSHGTFTNPWKLVAETIRSLAKWSMDWLAGFS